MTSPRLVWIGMVRIVSAGQMSRKLSESVGEAQLEHQAAGAGFGKNVSLGVSDGSPRVSPQNVNRSVRSRRGEGSHP